MFNKHLAICINDCTSLLNNNNNNQMFLISWLLVLDYLEHPSELTTSLETLMHLNEDS